MKYLLDTNICIYIIKNKPPAVRERFNSLIIGDVGVSSITVAELQFGVQKSQYGSQNQAALDQFLAPLEIVPFDQKAAVSYGLIGTLLESKGTPIGALNTLIAAHAYSLDCILVTNNESEFRRVLGLSVENWVEK